jgi:hypothetical protein
VPIEHLTDRDRDRPRDPRCHGNLRNVACQRRMRSPARTRQHKPQASAVSGGACLGVRS